MLDLKFRRGGSRGWGGLTFSQTQSHVRCTETIIVTPVCTDSRVGLKFVRLAPNEINLGILKISFSTFWIGEPKCTETDLKKSYFDATFDISARGLPISFQGVYHIPQQVSYTT